ncbi:MAG: hypothetical protein J6S28_04735 [Clostridia bacterium]|nr:hypothetical protein [Clostridia bacterium]MBO7295864.1 hypothetical protein [Clostridia bacterium]
MAIHFDKGQYETLRQTYRKWWAGELDRPIIPILTVGHGGEAQANALPLGFTTAWDTSINPKEFIDAFDKASDTHRWHGEAFPMFYTQRFGPGVLAAFLGCTPRSTPETIWFEPPRKDIPIEELHFEFDEQNPYYRRIANLYEAAMEKWHGSVVMGMTDLGGIMDVLQSFRGAENLLMDLYDAPEEVLRCVGELQRLWFMYFDKFNAIMEGEAQGYSHWYGMYHERPGYILQSDFSFMIGPDMFKTFVAPELSTSADRLYNAVYHLDGEGELVHLDTILGMEGIKGIQWVPSPGNVNNNHEELLCRILDAGKKVISHASKPDGTPVDAFADRQGQLYFKQSWYFASHLNEARRYAGMYGIEIKE